MGTSRAFVLSIGLLAAAVAGAQPIPSESLHPPLARAETDRPLRLVVGVRLGEAYRAEGTLDAA